MSTALLIIRIALGGALFLQGIAKLTREGRKSTADFFADVGFRPAAPLAVLAGLTEFASGGLLLAGLATPLAAAGAIGLLLMAAWVSSANGYWNAGGGAEYPIVLTLIAASLAFSGAGDLSVDAALGWDTPATATSLAAIALGVLSTLPMIARRQTGAPANAAVS